MRDNWTTATAGRSGGYGIISRSLLFIGFLCCCLTIAWAVSNQTIIRFEIDAISRAAP